MATVQCPICLDSDSEVTICQDNGHEACKSCVRTYILNELKEKGNLHCPIPDCPDALSIESLRTCLADEPISVRQEAVLHYRRKASESTHSCDFCGGAVNRRKKDGTLKYRCQICAKAYCPRCKKEDHRGACPEDSEVEKFAQSEEIDRCPNCGVLATKDAESCNSVTCTQCGQHFAWKNRATLWSRESYGDVAHVWEGDTVHQNDPLMAATALAQERAAGAAIAEREAERFHVVEARGFAELQAEFEHRHRAELEAAALIIQLERRAEQDAYIRRRDMMIEEFVRPENIAALAEHRVVNRALPYFTVSELQGYCRRNNIPGFSKARKAILLNMIVRHLEGPERQRQRQIAEDAEIARRLQIEQA